MCQLQNIGIEMDFRNTSLVTKLASLNVFITVKLFYYPQKPNL